MSKSTQSNGRIGLAVESAALTGGGGRRMTWNSKIELELYAAIVEHSNDAIISKTIDGTVITWNSAAERIFGYSAAEMIGHPITRLFPADLLYEEALLIEQLQSGRRIAHFETRRVRKDGTSIDVSVTLSPVCDAQGSIIAISKIARDITERHQLALARDVALRELHEANQQLRRSNQDLEAFAYTASHDLKSPLFGIRSSIACLEEESGATLSEDSQKWLRLIRKRIQRMDTLLDDLLAYSRLDRADTCPNEYSVADAFSNILSLIEPPAHISDGQAAGVEHVNNKNMPSGGVTDRREYVTTCLPRGDWRLR